MVGRAHSLFFAMQGMIDTTNIRWGSMPVFSAKYVLATAPNICWGDLAVDRQSTYSGNCVLIKRTQPGQQEVNIGQ